LHHKKSGLVAVLLACAALVTAARSDEPVVIRAAWINTPASLIPILFAKEGLAQHQGKTYQFQPVYYSSSPTQISAIASGELEIATLNFTSIPLAVLNAGLTDLRIIADETQAGVDGHATVEYAVLKESPIKTIEDLKGKTLATIGIGSGTDIAMRATLVKHGLEFQRDYTLVEARPAVAVPMLLDRKVDMIFNTVPFTYLPDYVNNARVLFTMHDGMGGAELSVWLARAAFIEKHRAAMVDLMEDMVRSYRWYADPANHKEAVEILMRATKQPAEQLDGWAFTSKDFGRNRDGIPDIAMLQRNIDTVQSLGFIKAHVDVSALADLSLVKEADQRLK
jgi:sulfonate transport system substrate-binding protein